MINPKITEKIESQLTKERFLFWYDTDQEYQSCIKDLSIPNVTVFCTDEEPALRIKLEIAQADSSQKFLFYSIKEQPDARHDWLLSYRLKGKSFSADATLILLDELGLASHALRPHLKLRGKFLAAKDRIERLKRWLAKNDTAEEVDLKILTVIVRADQAEPFSIFNQVLSAIVQDEEVRIESPSKIWSEVVQFQMEEAFWRLAKQTFGYSSDRPSLKNLIMSLLVSDLASSFDQSSSLPQQLAHFVLGDRSTKANARVFVSRWRSDINMMSAYVHLTQAIASEMHIDKLLMDIPLEAIINVHTFDVIERNILTALKQEVLSGSHSSNIASIIQARKNGFWANLKVAKEFDLTKAYSACYSAIEAAHAFFELKEQYGKGFSFLSAAHGLEEYKSIIYRFDQSYRHFHYAASLVEPMGWTLLHDLTERIENAYSGWFVPQFSLAWNKLIEGNEGLLNRWKIDGWPNQYEFYNTFVQPLLNGNVKRVFVLISDAFRYEAAEELSQMLNARNKYQAGLRAMLGVLPSYTSLGMASLLPHKTLRYKRGQNISVLADDLPTSGLEQRSAILNQYQGVAIKHEDLLAIGKDKGREFIKPYQVVYIYHDRVDAIGDKQATETKTFEAVDQTVNELAQVVSFVFNSLSASTLYVTADHGFMYQESALETADKSNLIEKPNGAYITKKRYMLGDALGDTAQAWYGNTHNTAGTEPGEGSVDFWVPKGANRFHFTGGARFVHGSAMPQEIVVPLITVKQLDSEKNKTKFVEIALLGSVNKIVTNMQRFELIQTEPVSDCVLARTVKVAIQDGQSVISDEPVIAFNKAEPSLDERKESVILTLKSGDFDRHKDYYFTIKDLESGVELVRHPMKIDLSFTNDF